MQRGLAGSAVRVYAVAALAFRAAVRSRLLLCMAAFLLLVTFGLPATIVGDGTLTGRVHVLLDYALGLSALALSVAMLWTSCAGVSKDIEHGHLRLVAVRPVYRIEIWLGKWLGLLALSGLLLAIAGAGTYGLLQWQLRRAGVNADEHRAVAEQILVGQRRILPAQENVAAEAEARLAGLAAQGAWDPELMPRGKTLQLISRAVLGERACVAPGGTRAWTLFLPAHVPETARVTLRIHISPSSSESSPLAGRWTLTSSAQTDRPWTTSLTNYSRGVARLELPGELARGGQSLRVDYFNTPGPQSGTVIFDIDHGVELLISESSFGSNLVRALLITWCRIGLLCAFGLAAGTFFSFPVAAFFASSVVLLCMTGHFFITSDWVGAELTTGQQKTAATILQQWSEPLIRALERVAAPAVSESPLAMLSDGILVSWTQTLQSAALLLGLYGGVLALVSAWVLRRRELA